MKTAACALSPVEECWAAVGARNLVRSRFEAEAQRVAHRPLSLVGARMYREPEREHQAVDVGGAGGRVEGR
jgi:hypothetical protein